MAGPISHTTLWSREEVVSSAGHSWKRVYETQTGSPGGDGVSVLLVDTVHSRHCDHLDVFLLYPHVGAFDGHQDPTIERAVARDDLRRQEINVSLI